MATVSLTFSSPINISCKVNDTAYYTDTTDLGGFSVGGGINLIGNINSITDNGTTVIIVVEIEGELAENVTENSFILFSKNNLFEIASLTGYFAEVTFKNNSVKPAELYATACEIEESSK